MFSLKRKNDKTKSTFSGKIDGMHCTSCAMNIDGELEDLGVTSSKTSYAKSQIEVSFDPDVVTEEAIKRTITDLGYGVTKI